MLQSPPPPLQKEISCVKFCSLPFTLIENTFRTLEGVGVIKEYHVKHPFPLFLKITQQEITGGTYTGG